MKKSSLFLFSLSVVQLSAVLASAQGLIADTNINGLNVSGKVVSVSLISRTVRIPRGQSSEVIHTGAALQKGQTALFEMELQDRSNWNNGNVYSCAINDGTAQNKTLLTVALPLIDLMATGPNVVHTSNSPRLTSGTHSWAYVASTTGALFAQTITCTGVLYGNDSADVFVSLKKTVLEN